MIDRSDSILIDRPVEEVFAYVGNVTNDPTWHTDVLEVRSSSDVVGRARSSASGSSLRWAYLKAR